VHLTKHGTERNIGLKATFTRLSTETSALKTFLIMQECFGGIACVTDHDTPFKVEERGAQSIPAAQKCVLPMCRSAKTRLITRSGSHMW